VVRSTVTQETVLRQQLQSAFHAIKSKFDQVEDRQQALEAKAGQEFSMLQRQMAESQAVLHAILGELKKQQRNDRQSEDADYEL
jgi:hypothetical protein